MAGSSWRAMVLACGVAAAMGTACGERGPGGGSRPTDAGRSDASGDGGAVDAGSSDASRDSGATTDSGGGTDSGSGPAGTCNIFQQTGCMAGEGCYLGAGGTQCAPAGGLAEGDPCTEATNECGVGLGCAKNSCHRYCQPGGSGTCAESQTCVPVAGGMGVGVCTPAG